MTLDQQPSKTLTCPRCNGHRSGHGQKRRPGGFLGELFD